MMPPMPGGQPPPEDIQRFLDEQERRQRYDKAVQHWYDTQMARIEQEHRERVLHWGAILCACQMDDRQHPCPVHGNILITLDGKVL